jgi:hypothetical protein
MMPVKPEPRQKKQGALFSPTITIEADEVRAVLPEGAAAVMKLEDLFERSQTSVPDSCGAILPDGVKCMLPMANGCILVHQTTPRVYNFRWISGDSRAEYGPQTSYRPVRLALPYVIVLAVFESAHGDIPRLSKRNECFFLNEPLDVKGMDTELCYPALLNCSRFPDGPDFPLSWICTQNLPPSEYARGHTLAQSLRMGIEALLRHLLESGFNRSSEHHELNSWFAETVAAGVDPRIASVRDWERATKEDPLFVLEVPWLPTGLSLAKVADRIARVNGRAGPRITCAEDVARLVMNARPRRRRTR